ncbi:hypothetical protein EHQ68_11030 [Leptospira congkakensis]|uniref:Uncharacterized protein n=1 Tax=Leptospira congkakensis TaxID=2484932 RepID=A0A4Z1A3E6_9LEPT|nr:hypothetical protein [Leptospira congkakensis]TGL88345.1 hypothetical protein EHQ68_11030 [Leptospira congkakensis]TGL95450.1 hypothetical protein EHQ69_03215 [Leptospira congkakensis]TGL96532.1 hypothetical protein EHQ70_10265 [Leptospira congkakensis]
MYSPKASIFISLFSGLGLLGVVFIAPVKEPAVKELESPSSLELGEEYVYPNPIKLKLREGNSQTFEYKKTLKSLSLGLLGDVKEGNSKNSKWNSSNDSGSKIDLERSPQSALIWDAKLSGEPSLSQPILTTPVHPSATLIFRQMEANKRLLVDPKQLYEYQDSFSPSRFVKVQTSVYNVKTENPVTAYGAEGGKFSFFFGSDKVQLNVKYNYVNARPNAAQGGQTGFSPTQDIASLGFIVFLGPSKNYSLYVGNQIFNVFNDPLLQVKDQNGKSPETFSASFRGKHPGRLKTTFFLNFQNQFYKDGMLIGVPGGFMYGNGFNGKSFYEQVTSLGMELAF